jgi:hypothetical protein
MNRSITRLVGIALLITAPAVAILNLHRVADLRMPWLAPALMILGIAFVVLARRRSIPG